MCKYSYRDIVSAYTGNNLVVPFDGQHSRADKIAVECPTHGIFQQAVSSILSNKGCRQCYFDKLRGGLKYSTEEWIKTATDVHGGYYNYSLAKYQGAENKVIIICPVHGEFSQQANLHTSGHGCPRCSVDKMVAKRSYSTGTYIQAAQNIHGSLYSYDKTVYTGSRDKLVITCPVHGDFEQVAYYHTAGNGCPTCGVENTTYKSKPEYEIIDFISSLGDYNIRHGSRDYGFELDIYIEEEKFAVEYNGIYWHSSNSLDKDSAMSKQHVTKTQVCEANGIRLFHIFENEWLDPIKKEIWKSMIRHALSCSERVYARKCTVRSLSSPVAKDFISANHLQDSINSTYYYGLCYNNTLMAVLSLGNSRYTTTGNNALEIHRFCNLRNYTVVGGLSKLLSHISKEHSADFISYANRRWSAGNVYEQCGFTLKNVSGPCYYYVDKNMNLYHRSSFTKKAVSKQFPNSQGTEASIMYDNGYRRIWDSGNKVYIRYRNVDEK